MQKNSNFFTLFVIQCILCIIFFSLTHQVIMHVILNISDSDKHFSTAIEEYQKRLWKDVFFDTLKPFKDDNHQLVIQKETESVIKTIEKKYQNYKKILLAKEWKLLTTEELWKEINSQNCVFIIWWPYGLNRKELKSKFSELKEISFWAITMPHWLAKLVLIEQIYRCKTIQIWKSYHY